MQLGGANRLYIQPEAYLCGFPQYLSEITIG